MSATTASRTTTILLNDPSKQRLREYDGRRLFEPHVITVIEDLADSGGSRHSGMVRWSTRADDLRVHVTGPNVKKDGELGKMTGSAHYRLRGPRVDEMPAWLERIVHEHCPEVFR